VSNRKTERGKHAADEKLGFSPINLDGRCTAEWEIPYQVIGAGEEPQAILIEYETPRGVVKEKIREPGLISWAIKNVKVPDSAKNRIPPDFEGILKFDNGEDFPAAMGSARKSLLNKAGFCYTLNGTGVSIENGTNRSIDIESVDFVQANEQVRAYLDEAYAQKTLVSARKLCSQERDRWIVPKDLYPLWQETRHVKISFRIWIGEESFLGTIEKIL
jgi:hypothetical protein